MRKIAKLLSIAVFLTLPVSVLAADESPTDLDTLLKGNEYKLPALDASYRVSYSETAVAEQNGKSQGKDEMYVLQFDALASFDVAQARRAKLQAQTGYGISLVFDAPFYKLRGGSFKKKSDAEDKARELSVYNISAFVVKIR